MEERERAPHGMRVEVGAQPAFLRRARGAGRDARLCNRVRALGVEGDDMPASDLEAVVPGATRAGRPVGRPDAVEVVEVARRLRDAVLVVADHGSDERLQPSPGRVEGRHELRELTVLVLDVAQGQHGGEVHLEQCVGRGALSAPPAEAGPAVEVSRDRVTGDVPGRGDDGVETRGLPVERARARGARSDPAQPAAVTAHHVQPPARPRGSERERERVPVGRPRGRARAVIQPREAPPLAPVGTHQVDVMDASTGSRERDEATVGRPRRLAIVGPPAGQPLRAAAAAGDREDVAVTARGTAHEGDPASRGPGRRVLVGARGRQAHQIAAVRPDAVDVLRLERTTREGERVGPR